jgi:hypothetical protein
VSQEDVTLVVLVGLPLVAVLCLGLLVREFINGGGRTWPLWLIGLVVCIVVWFRFVAGVP